MTDLLGAQRAVFGSVLRSTDKLVLLAILDHWSAASPRPFPSVERLGELTSLDERSVRRAVKRLAGATALVVVANAGRANSYDLGPVFRSELPRESHPGQRVTPGKESPRAERQHHPGHSVQRPRAQSPVTPGTVPAEGTKEGTKEGTHVKEPRRATRARTRLDAALSDPRVQEIAAHYRARFKPPATWSLKAKHNGKGRALAVLDALDAGHSVESCKGAIDGLASSDWHRENGHTDLELAMRLDKIEGLIARARSNGRPSTKRGPAPVSASFGPSGVDLGKVVN